MKGVVLAGGTGSRLRPITHTGPKQLVPIANKPVIDYAIEDLVEAGIDEIAVVLGRKGREEIQSHLGDGSEFGVDITYIVQGRPLGIAHAIGCARDFVGGEPFVAYLGDDLMREGIVDLVEEFDPECFAASLGLQRVDEPSRYGIVDVDGSGNITTLAEKPDDPPNNLAVIGIYLLTPSIFEQIESLKQSWRGEYEMSDALQGLLEDGHRVQSHVVQGWWKDTGKPEDVLHANRLVLDDIETEVQGTIENEEDVTGRLQLGSGSTVADGAVVRGPVSIGEDTHVGPDAYVGPYTSIGNNCEVDRIHIEASVVVGDSELSCERTITDSIIGRSASLVTGTDRKPAGDRLVIGQNSRLEL